MFLKKNYGFTLVEIMVTVMILGVLFTGIFFISQPYMMRSRDTDRTSSLFQYTSILETYEKSFDTFPSNNGSGSVYGNYGYCLSELATRGNVATLGNEGKFNFFSRNSTSAPPIDPDNSRLVAGCSQPASYLYSRLVSGASDQLAILGASLEIRTSANYGTGTDLLDNSKYQEIIAAKKSTVPLGAPDQIFVVTILR